MGEAVAIAAYVLNGCPTKKLKKIVPLEKGTRDRQSVIHLKVIGFICYKHVPNAKRRKLDDRSRVMLLVGYHNISAYKLHYLITNKELNIDVIVKELEA